MAAVFIAAVIAPSFINWTPYRETFARQLSTAIGRPVAVDGKITFALVPRPALEARNIRIGSGDDAIAIEDVKAWLALVPLLRGELYFRDLRLDEVRGTLQVSLPWEVHPTEGGSAPQSAPSRGMSLDVDRLTLKGGDLALRGESGAALARLQGMDLVLSTESRDRFRLVGDVNVDGRDFSLDAQLGAAGQDGARAISATARIAAADAAINASGRLDTAPFRFAGDATLKAGRGAAAFAAIGFPAPSGAAALERPLVASAKSTLDADGLAFAEVALDLGGTTAKGTVDWRPVRIPRLKASFDFAPFTLEDWRSSPGPPKPSGASTPAAQTPPAPAAAAPTGESLTAEFIARLPAVSYRGQGLRDGVVTATLANRELKITEAAVTLPGATKLSGFGLVSLADLSPTIDGVLTLQTFDARGLFSWLGADVSAVPAGRLGNASLQGALQGTLDLIELSDLEGTLDTSRIAGRLSFAPRARPFLGVDLRIQNVNVDSYRGTGPAAPRPATSAAPPVSKPDVYGVMPSGASFAQFADFDAEVHLQLDDITAGGLPGGRAGLDLGLKGGKLDVRTASFEKIAGATGWLSGSVAGLGTALAFEKIQFDLVGDDIARFAALTSGTAPPFVKSLGQVALAGSLNGSALLADVTATFKAAGLTARASGQLMDIEKAPRFNGVIEATHPKFSELMKATASWPSAMRDPGALALQVRVVQEPRKTSLGEAKLSIGRDSVTGAADISKIDGQLQINAQLADISLDLDRLLPPEAAPAAPPATAVKPVAAMVGPPSPWSQESVRWSFLKGWSGEISVGGPLFVARGVQLQDFTARITVADAAAELSDWKGKLFGAPGELFLRIAARPEPSLQGQIAVNRADFRGLVSALNAGRGGAKSGGTADVVASFAAKGTSAAAFAASLSGSGTLKVTAADVGSGLSSGLFGPLSAAAQLDVTTPGKPAPSVFTTRLTASSGIIKLENAEVSSRSHTGRFAGAIDLPRRQVDLSGTLVPRKAGEDQLPISIKGAVDRPNIRLLPPPK